MISLSRPGVLNRILFAIATLLIVVLVASYGYRLFNAVTSLRSAPHDNVQWTLAQLEVDLLMLTNATLTADEKNGALDQVRERFDILYSRINTLSQGRVFAELRNNEQVRLDIDALDTFLQRYVGLVDGADDPLAAALPEISSALAGLRQTARKLSLTGVSLYAQSSDEHRAKFEQLLLTASLIALALILLLVFTLAILYRLFRVSKSRAEEIQHSSTRQLSTINASLDAIVVINDAGTIIEMNKAAETVFGFARKTAVGADMASLLVPEHYLEAHHIGMSRFRDTGEKRVVDQGRVELSAMRADGTEFPVELSIGSALDKSGSIFIAYIRDISQRIEGQNALTKARDEALAADRAKSDFIAVMSHEMRTPLNGLLGVLDLLKQTDLVERQRQYLNVATSSGEILLRHVNDVLDIARIEVGKISLDSHILDFGALVAGVADVNRPAAKAHGVRIIAKVKTPAHPLAGDNHRLRQILLNLVGNAVKFTPQGKVTIGLDVLQEFPDSATIEMHVSDTGIGISHDDQSRIFDDFVTVDASYNRRVTGTGLGLAVCKRLVEAMDGEIFLESTPGQGSRFSVRLTLPHATGTKNIQDGPATGANDTLASVKKLNILIVEDNETNRFVINEMLRSAGHRTSEAIDGHEGVAMAQESHFDLILMDISMPGMDGMQATKAIRSGNGPCRNTAIIGLTAHVLPEEQLQFAKTGMQHCLTKPIRMATLNALLMQLDDNDPSTLSTGVVKNHLEDPIDLDVLDELITTLSPDVLRATLIRALKEIDEGIINVKILARQRAFDALKLAVHKIAGTAAILGATHLNQQLADIENACKTGRMDDALAAIEGIAESADKVTKTLEEYIATIDED